MLPEDRVQRRLLSSEAADEVFYATVRHPHQGNREDITRSEFFALRAMAVGYERIDRRDALRLYTLRLCYKSRGGFQLTSAGREVISDEYHDGTCA